MTNEELDELERNWRAGYEVSLTAVLATARRSLGRLEGQMVELDRWRLIHYDRAEKAEARVAELEAANERMQKENAELRKFLKRIADLDWKRAAINLAAYTAHTLACEGLARSPRRR
jgi:hypothetical protein